MSARCDKSSGHEVMDFLHFLSASCSKVLLEQRDSVSHGQGGDGHAGLESKATCIPLNQPISVFGGQSILICL